MDVGRAWQLFQAVVLVVLVAAILVLAGVVPLPVPTPHDYDRTTVTAYDANGTRLARVDVRIADTYAKKYTGLSDTESLAPDEGMLFVYNGQAERTFVMRKMDFPLDMVFVGANGTITTVHHAPVPPPGTSEAELTRYRGQAKWVLEVNRNWTVAHGVDVGDQIAVGDAATGTGES